MRGSQHNDPFFVKENGKLGTSTNNSGGIQGGISNGENIIFRVAFKPVATIGREQVNFHENSNIYPFKSRIFLQFLSFFLNF